MATRVINSFGRLDVLTQSGDLNLTPAGDVVIKDHVIGTDVQAWHQALDDISGLSPSSGDVLEWDGSNWVSTSHAEEATTAAAPLSVNSGEVQLAVDSNIFEVNGSNELTIKDDGIGTDQITFGAIVNHLVNTGIDAAKLADGSVSNAEFQYLGSVTSDIQTQLDGKAAVDPNLTKLAAAAEPGASEDGYHLSYDHGTTSFVWEADADSDLTTAAAPLLMSGTEVQISLDSDHLVKNGSDELALKANAANVSLYLPVLDQPDIKTSMLVHDSTQTHGYETKVLKTTTNNATTVGVGLHTFAGDKDCGHFQVSVVGRNTTSGEYCAYEFSCAVYSNAGTATVLGSTNGNVLYESSAGYNVAITVDGANVRCSVTGHATEATEWSIVSRMNQNF